MVKLNPRRARPAHRLAAALGVLLLCACAAAPLAAQDGQSRSIAETRAIIAVRQAQEADEPDATVEAARAYLGEYPEGRFADEALLAIGQAERARGDAEAAEEAYKRLIAEHPQSPFSEQAMAESLQVLTALERDEEAAARARQLAGTPPGSLHRDRALMWLAQRRLEAEEWQAALERLEEIRDPQSLNEQGLTAYHRGRTLARVKLGQSAWDPLRAYLAREDSDANKAEVLSLVGEAARKGKRWEEALGYYTRLAEQHPQPEYMDEALFWRARLHERVQVPEDAAGGGEAVQQAIAYYDAYLAREDGTRRAEALVQRGRLHERAGNPEQALSDYEAALERDPALADDPALLQTRVELYRQLGRSQAALAALEQAGSAEGLDEPTQRRLRLEQASLHYEQERCAEVEGLLEPMPTFEDAEMRRRALFMRGFCRYRAERWERASYDLEALLHEPSYRQTVAPPLLEAYHRSGQQRRMVNLSEELLRTGELEPDEASLTRLAEAYDELGQPERMLATYRRLAELNPDAAQTQPIQLRMGEAELAAGNDQQAAAHFRAVLGLEEKPGEEGPGEAYRTALERLRTIYAEAGQFAALEEVLAQAEPLLQSEEDRAALATWRRELYTAWGERALAEGDAGLAAEKLELALERTPREDVEARLAVLRRLLDAYGRLNRQEDGVALVRAELEAAESEELRERLTELLVAPLVAQAEQQMEEGDTAKAMAYLHQAIETLPAERFEERYRIAQRLDGLYAEEGDHAARAALLRELTKSPMPQERRDELERQLTDIYRAWGNRLAEEGNTEAALFQFERALALMDDDAWQRRYPVVSDISAVLLEQGRYTELVLRNEEMLPQVEDEALRTEIRSFLGQVYLDWARRAEEEENLKSARIRYAYALDYLPEDDWRRRLAAANGVAAIHRENDEHAQAAAAYEQVLPAMPEGDLRQQYALYLGRLYLQTLQEPGEAERWLKEADRGDGSAVSVEAGYQLADLALRQNDPDTALARLRGLAERGLNGSKWLVPIHYRLAVLLHRREALEQALEHYRVVAGVESAELRNLYPRSIEEARNQVEQIERYLQSSGRRSNIDISVPRVRE